MGAPAAAAKVTRASKAVARQERIRNRIKGTITGKITASGGAIDFLAYKRAMWKGYTHTDYQALIGEKLEQVARYIETGGAEGIGRLMIFMPPRHGKSTALNFFQSWLLGKMPATHIITTSYAARRAEKNSRNIRNHINQRKYREFFPRVSLSKDSKSVQEWEIDQYEGGCLAAGVGGSITGFGANLIIIDDPVKNRSQAESDTYRERTKDWFNDDLLTRLEEPGGAIIVVMTRWHQDDLAGWLLNSEDGDEWEVINFPALAEENDPLGRAPGEALWKERYTAAWLLQRMSRLGPYSWASLYQQRPVPKEGGLFDPELIEIIEVIPVNIKKTCRFYDLAVTTKSYSDYTVGLKLAVAPDEVFYIMDIYRVRKEAPDVYKDIKKNAQADGKAVKIRLEADKAGIIQLQTLLRDPEMRGYAFDAKAPEGDKYTRATVPATRVNGGRMKMLKAKWNQAFKDELGIFPAGEHDDQVDALSGAFQMLTEAAGVLIA